MLKFYTTIALLLYFAEPSSAQTKYTYTRYTQEHGLASGTIRGMHKDTTGYIWLLSEEGISRFDGYGFKVFRHNPDDSSSIPDNDAWWASRSNNGTMYFFFHSECREYDPGKLIFKKPAAFSPQMTRLTFFPLLAGKENSYAISDNHFIQMGKSKTESTLLRDPGNTRFLFVATDSISRAVFTFCDSRQISMFDLKKNKTEKIEVCTQTGEPDSAQIYFCYYFKEKNSFFGISKKGLYRYNEKTNCLVHQFNLPVLNKMPGFISSGLAINGHYMYNYTQDGQLHKVDIDTGEEQLFYLNKKIPEDELKDKLITCMKQDKEGYIWIATRGMGLIRFNPAKDEWEQFVHEPGNPNSLSSNVSDDILFDGNGVIWVSCFGHGLVKMEPVVPVLKSASPAVKKGNSSFGGFNENVRTFLETDSGFYIGTLKGIYHYNVEKDDYSDAGYLFPPNVKTDGQIGTLASDSSGNTWIGTWFGELTVVNNKANKRISLKMPTPQGNVYGGFFRKLYCDRNNTMWISTHGAGTYSIRADEINFDFPAFTPVSSYFTNAKDPGSISSDFVFTFLEDKEGDLWAATDDGLCRLNNITGKWKRYYNIPGDATSLHNSNARSLAIDLNGNLWIGTNGGGLNRYNKAENNFTHFTMENGLPNDAVYSLLCDKNGMLWLGTNRGLCRFNPYDYTYKNYTDKDGIQNYEFNTGAALKLKNGTLLIGGVAGYNIIDPDNIESKKPAAPAVVISSFKIFGKEYPLGNNHLVLKHTQNSLAFEFAALSYYRNQDNRYAYMMEGVDQGWINCDARRFVSYSNLQPGEYVFKVKACNSDGVWNETGIQVHISITPPWWQRLWARILFVLLVLGTVIAYYRYRTNALRARQKELETEIHKATDTIRKQKEAVEEEKKRSDELLLNILPAETAEELKKTGSTKARDFEQVTVLFTDFKNFTSMSEKLSSQDLVNEINYCYSAFDHIITKYGIEKIKTIGDAYMCAGGLPVANQTNAFDTVNAALEMRDFINEEKQKRIKMGLPYFEIRIGCHTGPVVAGIVGIKKFAYDIWGDTVNIAARMETSGETGKVNISGMTYEIVKYSFNCSYRGKIDAKNKGEIDMYFVERK